MVASRLAELAVAQLLVQARKAAEAGDWGAIDRMLAEARQRYARFLWVIEVLESAEEIARSATWPGFPKSRCTPRERCTAACPPRTR